MNHDLNARLARWREAGVVDGPTAARIEAFEARGEGRSGLRWPVILAIAFGALMVGAGVLLFVAAHWDRLSPAARFASVLAMVGFFHAAGAYFTERFPKLSIAMHGLGTLALGAGIFLAGQIFNLEEHWPGGIMLWAAGAWLGYALLRDWVQGISAALLTPFWLSGEWTEATPGFDHRSSGIPLAVGVLLLAIAYVSARRDDPESALRRALGWAGEIALIPAAAGVAVLTNEKPWEPFWHAGPVPGGLALAGWTAAIAIPLGVSFLLRGRHAWTSALAMAWGVLLAFVHPEVMAYLWCAAGAVGLVAWGLREGRPERINLGVSSFALTLLCFYFSNVMDKLGRSLGLMGLGALFLLAGWTLERARRRLLAQIAGAGGAV
jgi:Predicted membrane protein (DUF2157)